MVFEDGLFVSYVIGGCEKNLGDYKSFVYIADKVYSIIGDCLIADCFSIW